MNEFGINQLIAVVLLVGATVFPLWLAYYLRRTRPGVMWIGLLLCLIFGPLGQLYVAGWLPWFLIVLGVCVGAQMVLVQQLAMMVIIFTSPVVMFFRMRK